MGLYHKDVYMTKDMISQCPDLYCGNLETSSHFFSRNKGLTEKYIFDKNRFDDIIDGIRDEKPNPFEVETDDKTGKVVKCCIRYNYDDYRDICIVFRKDKIITFWFNGVSDNHLTLDESKYCRA